MSIIDHSPLPYLIFEMYFLSEMLRFFSCVNKSRDKRTWCKWCSHFIHSLFSLSLWIKCLHLSGGQHLVHWDYFNHNTQIILMNGRHDQTLWYIWDLDQSSSASSIVIFSLTLQENCKKINIQRRLMHLVPFLM